MIKKVGILYIATGRYITFWEDFFLSSERFFLTGGNYQINYFVFTDADKIKNDVNTRVHKIKQENLPWPFITLDRFSIFQNSSHLLEKMDYLYFFNANMLFVSEVGEDILPNIEQPLVFIKHPGFYNRQREEFTYETDVRSTAAVGPGEGRTYFMGGLNGGIASQYLKMIHYLQNKVALDKTNEIVAIWHDESHLNRFAIDHPYMVKALEPIYGYPEGWELSIEPKIIIRDKRKYGGHNFLRNYKKSIFKSIKGYFRRKLRIKLG